MIRGPRRRAVRGPAALLALTLVVTGCTPDAHDGGPATPGATVPGTESDARPATRVTLAFGGDVHFEGGLRALADDPHSLDELLPTLGAADFSMVDLETSLGTGGTPIPGKAYTFQAPVRVLDVLANAGVDAVTMANNHAFDFQEASVAGMRTARERGPIAVLGVGMTEDEAFAAHTADVRGVSVAVIAGDQVGDETLWHWSAGPDSPGVANTWEPDRLMREVRAARETHDVVVVYLHWGFDGDECPYPRDVERARQLVDAGVDVIIGDHSHRVGGMGWVGNSFVSYGMGNFVFYRSDEPSSRTGVLTLTLDVPAADAPESRDHSLRTAPMVTAEHWQPMLIGTDGVPRIPAAADVGRLHGVREAARACTPARTTP